MYYAYAELDELEEEMHRSFHSYFKKDINVESKIGVVTIPHILMGKREKLNF